MNEKFLDADEDEDILMTRMFIGEQAADTVETSEFEEFAEPFAEIEDDADLLEIPGLADDLSVSEAEEFAAEPVNLDPLIESPPAEFVNQATQAANFQSFDEKGNEAIRNDEKVSHDTDFFANSPYQTETSDETIRKSGLAYAAAIILFGSIVFTLILGWFADLLLGTSPWGKVGGIVLGAIIGFVQFFRTTSQILKDKE